MSVINVLDKQIAKLIAAGEVVERPASVIKELVENSIDAKSKNITIEIKNGGTTFMRVTDDGIGISKDDIKKAFLPHATSKIKVEDDLDSIATLGFRGEALSSICAVSQVEIFSKTKKQNIGASYSVNGGEEGLVKEAGSPDGTTIIIRDLFYNIPARMKFLKRDVSEGNAISAVVDKVALSHPEISFTYIRDGKTVLKTSGDNKLISAIYSVYGRDFAKGVIPVKYELNGVRVWGYVSKPLNARPNRNMQNFFLNGRYVKSQTAAVAVAQAGKGFVMSGKFSSCVLHISISYEAVDVNVHPSKIEVRFINERPIFDAVYHGVKSAFMSHDKPLEVKLQHEPQVKNESLDKAVRESIINKNLEKIKTKNDTININKEKQNIFNRTPKRLDNLTFKDSKATNIRENPFKIYEDIKDKTDSFTYKQEKNKRKTPQEPIIYTPSKNSNIVNEQKDEKKDIIKDNLNNIKSEPNLLNKTDSEELKPLIEEKEDSLQYIGELFKTYILVEKHPNKLIIIDKHAAHERMIFEKLKKDNSNVFSQILLTPVTVTLNKTDYNSVINNLDLLNNAGFEVEDFGNGVVLARSAPQYLENVDISETIIELAGYLSDNINEMKSKKMEWIYDNIACRAAIKAGNKSTEVELMEIVNTLEKDKTLRYCPHGRPVRVALKKKEIEKYFGRT